MRRCVPFVFGMANDLMISSGARGRGLMGANASAGLVNTAV